MSLNKQSLTTRQRKSRKTKIIVIVCIAALVGGWYIFMKPKSTKTGDLPPLTVKKEIEHNQIEVSGYIEAAQTQVLEAPGEGFIEQVLVKEGNKVKKGALLFALDTDKQSYAVAEHAFAIKREQINGASQKLSLMEQEQRLLEKQLADRKVYAKFDGIVAALKITQGQYAKAKDTFGTLIDRSFLKATVEIAESDASRLAVGQKVDMTFPAEPDIKVQAEVISYPAIARLTSLTGADSEALIVEQDAIRYVEGKPFVDKIDGTSTQEIAVTVEPYIKGFVKILSGVQENDVLKNQAKLNNDRDF